MCVSVSHLFSNSHPLHILKQRNNHSMFTTGTVTAEHNGSVYTCVQYCTLSCIPTLLSAHEPLVPIKPHCLHMGGEMYAERQR